MSANNWQEIHDDATTPWPKQILSVWSKHIQSCSKLYKARRTLLSLHPVPLSTIFLFKKPIQYCRGAHWNVFEDTWDKASLVLKLVGTIFKNRTFIRLCPKIWWGHVPMSPYVPSPLNTSKVPKLNEFLFDF